MKESTRFVGLDDSKTSIEVAVAEGGRDGEVRRYGVIPNTPEALRKLVRSLGRPKHLYFVYEAGPGGYGIYRELWALGASCMVAAPTKTPRRVGDQIKNDRRDADTLARLHRAGELTPVWVPDEVTEAMRDLTRSREDFKYAQTRARQRLQRSFSVTEGATKASRTGARPISPGSAPRSSSIHRSKFVWRSTWEPWRKRRVAWKGRMAKCRSSSPFGAKLRW